MHQRGDDQIKHFFFCPAFVFLKGRGDVMYLLGDTIEGELLGILLHKDDKFGNRKDSHVFRASAISLTGKSSSIK